MAQKAIRFQKISADSSLVAIAQVSLFPGVYLRGWHIIKKNDKVEVMLPHKIYQDPETGEEKIWSLLKFDDDEICHRWLDRIKKEYLKWERTSGASAIPAKGDVTNKG